MTKTAVIFDVGLAEGLGAYLGVKATEEGGNSWTHELDLRLHMGDF
jgi:hypothetical protein